MKLKTPNPVPPSHNSPYYPAAFAIVPRPTTGDFFLPLHPVDGWAFCVAPGTWLPVLPGRLRQSHEAFPKRSRNRVIISRGDAVITGCFLESVTSFRGSANALLLEVFQIVHGVYAPSPGAPLEV